MNKHCEACGCKHNFSYVHECPTCQGVEYAVRVAKRILVVSGSTDTTVTKLEGRIKIAELAAVIYAGVDVSDAITNRGD